MTTAAVELRTELLARLREYGPTSTRQLAITLRTDARAILDALDQLEADQLVSRQRPSGLLRTLGATTRWAAL